MDPRIEKTLEKLRNGLLSLVATEDPTDISISKLAKASGIDRKTFYLHYKDVNDVMNDLCDETVEKLTGRFTGDLKSDIETFYDFLEKVPENLRLLISGDKSRDFRARFLHGVFTSPAFSRYYEGEDSSLVEGYLYSILYIYEEYKRVGRPLDIPELAGITADLIEHGISGVK